MAKPIEQQVAELTNEQRNKIKSIYKKMVIVEICCIVIGLIISACSFMIVTEKVEEAKVKYDIIQAEIAGNEKMGEINISLFDESSEAMDEYYDLKEIQIFSLLSGLILAFVGIMVSFGITKVKYPYFSEKKYTYLKKAGYFNNPIQ